MFRDLNSALDLLPNEFPDGKFILVSETSDVDGSFFIHHFLTYYLKSGRKVCILSLYQSFFHYHNVALKLGTNLNSYKEKGSLVFIEGLKLALEYQRNANENNPYTKIITQENPCLEKLYKLLVEEFDRLRLTVEKDTSSILIIDDLSVLVNLGVSPKEVIKFIHCCKNYCLSSSLNCSPSCFLALINKGSEEDDEENSLVCSYASYISDIFIAVKGLKTGFSKDVHGQMTITHMDPNFSRSEVSRKKTQVQFKAEERNIHIFSPGSSAAVL